MLTVEEKARQELEAGIQEHTRAILDMKHKLNQLVAIARLPPELLSEVFLHCIDPKSGARPYSWIPLSHVCHHWREVAVLSPRIWSKIYVTRLDCVKEMLERSKKVPIDVYAGTGIWHWQNSDDALRLVLKQFARMRTLELRYTSRLQEKDVPSSAPLLKTLMLDGVDIEMTIEDVLTSNGGLFEKCDMPSLERLEINNYYQRWASPIFRPTLTRLVLATTVVSLQPSPLSEVLDALEAMPLLEYVELKNELPSIASAGELGGATRVIDLPNLAELRVTDAGLSCASLLEHMSFPVGIVLFVDCRIATSDVRHVCPVLKSKLLGVGGTESAQPLLTVSLQGEAYHSTHFKAWSEFYPVSDFAQIPEKIPSTPRFTLVLRLPPDPLVFQALFVGLPLTDIQSLYLTPPVGYMHVPKDMWISSCASMTELRELCVGRWAEGPLPEVLSARIPLSADPPPKGRRRRLQPIFPKLAVLRFEGTHLRPAQMMAYIGYGEDKLLGRYRKALEKRNKSRVRLRELVINACYNIRKDDIDLLKGFAEHVRWDGKDTPQYGYENSDSEMYSDSERWDDTEDDEVFMPWDFGGPMVWF